jgi:hypothetical protein
MDLAGISVNEPVVVYSTGHGLVVSPAPKDRDEAFEAAKARVRGRHSEVLRRLAK